MDIHIVTAFPKTFDGFLDESILKRAIHNNHVQVHLHHIRDYAEGKHKQIDDYPYGGGAGMILKPEPIIACVEDIKGRFDLADTPVTLMTPAGETYTQNKAVELSLRRKLILLCGHYKGIDQRALDMVVDEEISIGDYVLTGGELAAMCITDSVVRLLPGVIGDIDSACTDSFQTGMLDCPHYTRPETFREQSVPAVLLSGNHKQIEQWRYQQAFEKTRQKRPDLLKKLEIEK